MKYESSWINEDVRMFRENMRAFIAKEFAPQQAQWRAQHGPESDAWLKAARAGLLLADEAMRFSVSHSGEIALFAFSEAREVGVDIEALRPIESADTIAAHILSRGELRAYAAARDKVAAFLRFWTRKEALAKALGDGLSIPPEKLEPSRAPGWRVHSFCPLSGFIAAVACHTGP